MHLPDRRGSRPAVSTEGPQTQLSQQSSPAFWGRLVARTFALPGVIEGHSQVSPPSSRAVFLADVLVERAPETSLAPGQRPEPVHLHGVHDTSIHLCLPAGRGAEVVAAGWGVPHQYEDFGTEFLLYGPRDFLGTGCRARAHHGEPRVRAPSLTRGTLPRQCAVR